MFAKATLPALKAFLKPDPTMSSYYVQGKKIQLGKNDFKAQGGEGSIYVKGSTAYKIYSDPKRTIAAAKIQELSVLTESNIIRPLHIVLDGHNKLVGYAMRYVGKTYALCQLFPKAFRQRNNLTPEKTLALVKKLQFGVAHIHSKQILVVDLNELNFLVATDFSDLFFIDVDSYQTPSFAATVLMESVRDRHAQKFTTGSDWFSFAVVSFQLFVGIHPFKGTYAPLQNVADKLESRMRANISVLHQGVTVPGSCLPLTVIPTAYLEWYRAVFEEGKRLPPPDQFPAVIQLMPTPQLGRIEGTTFVVREFLEFDSPVVSHDSNLTVTERSIYFGVRRIDKPVFDVKLAITPRLGHLIAAFSDQGKLRFHDLTTGRDLVTDVDGEDVMVNNGRFFLKQQENIFAVDFIEMPQNLLLGLRPVANVMMRATQLFEGLAIQNLLGATFASILTAEGSCHQVRLTELDGCQVISARLERNVLLVVTSKSGRYDKLIYRFAHDFIKYDVRIIEDIGSTDINFTVLDSNLVLHLTDESKLEIFSANRSAGSVRVLKDSLLESDVRLFHLGKQALISRDNKIFKINLQ